MTIRLDELGMRGWRFYQEPAVFCAGADAAVLAGAVPRGGGRAADLCAGSGAVGLLLLAGERAREVTALELDAAACTMARKSAGLCGCDMKVVCGDVRRTDKLLAASAFDIVTVNPPYYPIGRGKLPESARRAAARYEIACTADDALRAARFLLREDGMLYMAHLRERKAELVQKAHALGLHATELRDIDHEPKQAGKRFILIARKTANPPPCLHTTFYLYDGRGRPTPEYAEIFKEK